MHTDPSNYPPHFAGYADECGEGEGCHLSVVLKPCDGEGQIRMRFDETSLAIQDFGSEALVISLGFDTGSDDPLSEVGMTATSLAKMARRMAAMEIPMAYIQEGGYLSPSLGDNARAFFASVAFDDKAAALLF